ncbi:pro-opiomelanocortin-like [Hippoglossus hippoglossus]|uniref:pro-opiomelanocortin-like n=1 Tax=Hippoglossus hippoglossus TaxID=8267 RepID=UPI00148E17EC|nr:pro-opiomelanocortin-like [Hippoglossus hippoglossus]XP_034435722.1 pro-opiomelanocortin-like [Hippoglossus hippoglossus]
MLCLRWLSVAMMAYACVPGFGSVCLNSSICKNLSTERRIQNCIRLCIQKIQAELPQLNELALKMDDEKDLLLSIILAILASSEDKVPGVKPHSNERRSYSMEHFRWGKPTGRKRRPIKVFMSSLEGGGSSEVGFPTQVRRQLGGTEDKTRGDLNQQNQEMQRAKVKSQVPLSPQHRKDGSYRMSHFRWGNPPTSKRNGSFMRPMEEKSKAQLAKLLRNILHKDVQRIIG